MSEIGVKARVNSVGRFYIDDSERKRYVRVTLDDTSDFFKAAMNRPGRSDPGEFPANDSGALSASTTVSVTGVSGYIRVDTPYAGFLRDGTSKMAPRKMLLEAIKIVMSNNRALGILKGAVRFGDVG